MTTFWRLLLCSCLVSSVGLVAACGGDDDDDDSGADGDADADADSDADADGDADGVPAAPSGLEGAVMGDGIHMTWDDNSDNEDEFVIERAPAPDGDFVEIRREDANSTSYHDAPLNTGSYTYRVSAENASGRSAPAEGTFDMP